MKNNTARQFFKLCIKIFRKTKRSEATLPNQYQNLIGIMSLAWLRLRSIFQRSLEQQRTLRHCMHTEDY
jgi:hypothetical protein